MKIIDHDEQEFKTSDDCDKYIHFYESVDMPGFYLVERNYLTTGMIMYHVYIRTGEYDFGTGYTHLNIKKPVSVGGFNSHFDHMFEWYIFDNFVEEHKPHERGNLKDRAWFKFKVFEPEKWLNDFINYMKQKKSEYESKNNFPTQLSLF